MEEKYYEILRHYVNPNDCATVVKQLLSLHNVVGQSEQLCQQEWIDARNEVVKSGYVCLKCNNVKV